MKLKTTYVPVEGFFSLPWNTTCICTGAGKAGAFSLGPQLLSFSKTDWINKRRVPLSGTRQNTTPG